ncbi:inactive Ufm1-specific protease 1 isoform X3 [Pristis pectinata]|uniref:inactive Ufm1-specific protease 1 isoform X3 n=1 Tax=Pristis pectinata TaxID=685728 RepID=UPI00223D221F|nr:inactive Ufm1-specific protease 1 isoform X3 [Pristis pectinata]
MQPARGPRLPEDLALSMELVKNIHSGLPLPESESDAHRLSLIRGDYLYYHYGCDGTDDCGWGCGYRTMQTLSSWIILQQTNRKNHRVPTLREVQEALVEMEDKPPSFIDSKTWIGSFEIALCIDKFYDVPCKLIHVRQGGELLQKMLPDLQSKSHELSTQKIIGPSCQCWVFERKLCLVPYP